MELISTQNAKLITIHKIVYRVSVIRPKLPKDAIPTPPNKILEYMCDMGDKKCTQKPLANTPP